MEVSKIRVDGGTQSRAALDQNLINEYTEDMRNGALFPPVVVFNDGSNIWLAEGFHRYYATIAAGLSDVSALEKEGTLREAKRYAMSANADHGARRTNADKRRAVLMAFEDEEYRELSDREIASLCRVTHPFVSKVRKELSGNHYHSDQPSPNQTDSETGRLKKELAAREEFEKQQERELESVVNAKVQERLAQLETLYQEKQNRAVAERVKLEHDAAEKRIAEMKAKLEVAESAQKIDQNVIDKLVAEKTAGRVAELENAQREAETARETANKSVAEWHRQYQEKEATLERQLEKKMREIDEATKAEKDITALSEERRKLTAQITKLKADREHETKRDAVRFRFRHAESGIMSVLSIIDIVRADFGTPDDPDFCGLTIEEIEDAQMKLDTLSQSSYQASTLLAAILESVKKGGGIRVAR